MNQLVEQHPEKETLTAFALYSQHSEVRDHIESCEPCSRHVKEVRILRDVLQNIPEEEVPEMLRGAIIKAAKKKNLLFGDWFQFDLATWHKNPFLISIGLILFVIFCYIFFTFVL